MSFFSFSFFSVSELRKSSDSLSDRFPVRYVPLEKASFEYEEELSFFSDFSPSLNGVEIHFSGENSSGSKSGFYKQADFSFKSLEFRNGSLLFEGSSRTDSFRDWILSDLANGSLPISDPVFSFLKESEFLASQFDFFLNVLTHPQFLFLQLEFDSAAFHFERAERNDSGGFWFLGSKVLGFFNRSFSEEDSKPKFVKTFEIHSIFVIYFLDLSFFISQPERALIQFKLHRYLTLLLNFPPNFNLGQHPLC